MGPEKRGEETYFTVAESARILGVTKQRLYQVIGAGQLKTTREAYGRKISAPDLMAYGIQTGQDPQKLVARIQEETEADPMQLLANLLTGLGLVWLLAKLMGRLFPPDEGGNGEGQ